MARSRWQQWGGWLLFHTGRYQGERPENALLAFVSPSPPHPDWTLCSAYSYDVFLPATSQLSFISCISTTNICVFSTRA